MRNVKTDDISPALLFLQSAANAMPRTIGDAIRIRAMSDAMAMAISCRFKFNIGDEKKLRNLSISRQVGVFSPMTMRYYAMACACGGTYPKMWEVANKAKPWVTKRAIGTIYAAFSSSAIGGCEVMPGNRVAEGMGVLIPFPEDQDDLDLQRYDGAQVWWVTTISIEKDEIVLCRYRKDPKSQYSDAAFLKNGTPAKRQKMSRKQWDEMNDAQQDDETAKQEATSAA
jgi:hypothetical protein